MAIITTISFVIMFVAATTCVAGTAPGQGVGKLKAAAGAEADKCDGLLRAIASHPDDPGVERTLVEQFVALPYARLPASRADRAVDFSARIKCVEGIATLGVMRGDTNLLLSVCKHISELKPLPTDGREDDLSNARKLLLRLCHTQEEIDAFNNFKPDGKTMRGALLIHPEFCNLFDDIRNEYDARERYNAELGVYKRKAREILRPQTNASGQTEGLLPMADAVGELQLLPIDGYWEEFKAAAVADEKDGYHPRVSYPGHSGVGSISIMGRDWRPDTSKYGPRLKACVEKWRPTIEHNFTVGEKRRKALQSLCEALRVQRPQLAEDEFAILISNVVERAHLTPREVDMIFPKEGGLKP